MCGTAPHEWDPEHGGSKFAYEAVEEFCMGCYIKSAMSRDTDSGDGRSVVLLPTKGREAAKRHVAAARSWRGGQS